MSGQRRSLQLSLREKPQAVDYDYIQQLVAISTSSSLSIYRISSTIQGIYCDNAGCPSHVIYYEDSHSTRGTKLQKTLNGANLVASLKDVGCVSIYDVNTKSMKSLVDFIPPSQSIVGINWSHHSPSSLATCSSTGTRGLINLWDVRTAVQPVQQYVIGSDASMVEWWPTDPTIISVCKDRECLLLLDIRMSGSQSSAPSSMMQGVRRTKPVHSIKSLGGRICSYAWHCVNESSSITIATENGLMQNDHVSYDEANRLWSKSSSSVQSKFIGSRSKVLNDPTGQRILLVDLLTADDKTRSSIYAANYQDAFSRSHDAADGCTDTPLMNDRSEIFREAACSDVPLVDVLWMPTADGYSSDCCSSLHLMVLNSSALLQIIPIASNNVSNNNTANDLSRHDLKPKLVAREESAKQSLTQTSKRSRKYR